MWSMLLLISLPHHAEIIYPLWCFYRKQHLGTPTSSYTTEVTPPQPFPLSTPVWEKKGDVKSLMDSSLYCLKTAGCISSWMNSGGLNYALKIKLLYELGMNYWCWHREGEHVGDVSLFDFADACDDIDNSSSKKPVNSWSMKNGKTHSGYWKATARLLEQDG